MILTFTLPSADDMPELETRTWDTSVTGDVMLSPPQEKPQILVLIQESSPQRTVRQALLDSGYAAVEAADLDEVEEFASSEGPR